ncbi:MAG TPA: hypothetical protein VGF69_10155 [Thermoanaerobaculia bacterium]
MSAMVRFCFARSVAVMKFGMAMAATIPATARSTNNPTTIPITHSSAFEPDDDRGTAPTGITGRGAPFDGFPQLGQAA